jgi:GTP cyclohydrolase IA
VKSAAPAPTSSLIFDRDSHENSSSNSKLVNIESSSHYSDAAAAVRQLITFAGDDPERSGLKETPARVARSYTEIFSGYSIKPVEMLSKTFENAHGYCEPIFVTNISFFSMCEHHMLPFFGKAHIGYVPTERVVGLSKLARVVDAFAKRLQMQERLTQQIANSINEGLRTEGVAVLLQAQHLCMSMRGVGKQDATTTTCTLRGAFLENQAWAKAFFAAANCTDIDNKK